MVLILGSISGCHHSPPAREIGFHRELVYSVCFSPDGKQALSCGLDGGVRLWDLSGGRIARTFGGDAGGVRDAVFSPSGETILGGGLDGTVYLWETKTGHILYEFYGHGKAVYQVAYLPGEKRAVSCGSDQTVRMWDLSTGESLWRFGSDLSRHGTVYSVAVAQRGTRILAGCEDRVIRVLDAETGKKTDELTGHAVAVMSIDVSGDGRRALSSGAGREVFVWDLVRNQGRRIETAHTGTIRGVRFYPNEDFFLTGSFDGTIRLFRLDAGKELDRLDNGGSAVYAVDVSHDGSRILSGDYDGRIRLWRSPM